MYCREKQFHKAVWLDRAKLKADYEFYKNRKPAPPVRYDPDGNPIYRLDGKAFDCFLRWKFFKTGHYIAKHPSRYSCEFYC